MSLRHSARRWARLSARLGRAAARVARRRLQHGPHHPHWTFRYELIVAFMRDTFRRTGASPAQIRAAMDGFAARVSVPPDVTVEEAVVGGVPCTWMRSTRPGPTILYLHGGGYVFGSATSHRRMLVDLLRHVGGRVLVPAYRLAPEHPCPAAIDDALAVYRGLADPSDLWIAGDSAGGGLTVTTLVAARDAGLPMPAGAVLLSPWTDLSLPPGSLDLFPDDDWLGTRETLAQAAGWYAGNLDPRDPRVSPVYADLHGLCRTLVLVGGAEILRDDGVRLADALRAAGVDVTLHVEPGETHVWPAMGDLTPATPAAWRWIQGFMAPTG